MQTWRVLANINLIYSITRKSMLADGLLHWPSATVWVQRVNLGKFCCGQPFVGQIWSVQWCTRNFSLLATAHDCETGLKNAWASATKPTLTHTNTTPNQHRPYQHNTKPTPTTPTQHNTTPTPNQHPTTPTQHQTNTDHTNTKPTPDHTNTTQHQTNTDHTNTTQHQTNTNTTPHQHNTKPTPTQHQHKSTPTTLKWFSYVHEIKTANKTETTGEQKQEFWLVLRTDARNLIGLSNKAHKQNVVAFVRRENSPPTKVHTPAGLCPTEQHDLPGVTTGLCWRAPRTVREKVVISIFCRRSEVVASCLKGVVNRSTTRWIREGWHVDVTVKDENERSGNRVTQSHTEKHSHTE